MTMRGRVARTVVVLVAAACLVSAVGLAGCSEDDREPAEGATIIDLGGLKVQTISRGPSDPEPGPRVTVLFLHGASYTSRIWDDRGILDAVVDAGYWAVAADLPGFGDTPKAERPKEQFLAELVEAVSAPGEVVIVSPSKSGEWSLALLQDDPEVPLAGFVGVAPVGISDFAPPADRPKVPALLVWGEDDENIPLAKADELQAKLPGSRIAVVPGAGHAVYDDDPKGFLKVLLPFLAEVEKTVKPRT